jgi:hypothetical protein
LCARIVQEKLIEANEGKEIPADISHPIREYIVRWESKSRLYIPLSFMTSSRVNENPVLQTRMVVLEYRFEKRRIDGTFLYKFERATVN